MSNIELTIACNAVKVDADKPLRQRIESALRDVRTREHDIFWMSGRVDDDMRMRTALGAVLLKASDEEKDIISRSLKPLKMLAAASQGIPVDFSALESSDDLLPILGMWHETATAA